MHLYPAYICIHTNTYKRIYMLIYKYTNRRFVERKKGANITHNSTGGTFVRIYIYKVIRNRYRNDQLVGIMSSQLLTLSPK